MAVRIQDKLKGINIIELLKHSYHKIVRCIVFSIKMFKDDQCVLRASALTLYTILSIVPVMAMAFGIAKGFGIQKLLEKELYARFPGQDEILVNVINFSNNILEGTKSGVMALLGVIILFYSVLKMFSHIENAFNTIWWVKEDRPLIRKFTDYTALFVTAPLLTIASGSVTIFISAKLEQMIAGFDIPHIVEIAISFGFNIFPFITIWILFVFFYIFIPNTRIDIKSALAGGIAAGTVYQIGQILYLKFQVGVSHYNAIYGSFAAIPLFLLWLQASWIILLVGAEIAFAWENIESLEDDIDINNISIKMKKILILRIVTICVKRFANKESPATSSQISKQLSIPYKIVKSLLSELLECNILLEVNLKKGPGYTPASDIESLTIMDVINAFENKGDKNIDIQIKEEFQIFEKSLNEFIKVSENSAGERKLRELG